MFGRLNLILGILFEEDSATSVISQQLDTEIKDGVWFNQRLVMKIDWVQFSDSASSINIANFAILHVFSKNCRLLLRIDQL